MKTNIWEYFWKPLLARTAEVLFWAAIIWFILSSVLKVVDQRIYHRCMVTATDISLCGEKP